jgi:hypothetical protein
VILRRELGTVPEPVDHDQHAVGAPVEDQRHDEPGVSMSLQLTYP